MDKVLILGGSGFIGKNLILEYLQNNFTVINYDIQEFNIDNINLINILGKITDIENIEKICKEHKINHIVFLINTILPSESFECVNEKIVVNVSSVIEILNLASKYNIRKFVYFSSGGAVYGNYKREPYVESDQLKPVTFYGWSKKIVEDYIIHFAPELNIEYLIIRPSNPYGRYQNLFGKQGIIGIILGKIITNSELEIWGSGDSIKDYIYIQDLCSIYIKLIKKKITNQIYNIGSGTGTSLNDIISIIEEIYGDGAINKKYIIDNQEKININVLNINKIKKELKDIEFTDLKMGISQFIAETKK